MRGDDWYKPNAPKPPERQPKPGQEVWRLQQDDRIQSCELRDDSMVDAGWDVQLFEDGRAAVLAPMRG